MKTKRIFKKRTRPLRKQKSLKRKNRTKCLGGAIARLSQAAQGVSVATAGLTAKSLDAAAGVIDSAGTVVEAGEIAVKGTAQTIKRASVIYANASEQTTIAAGDTYGLALNLTKSVVALLGSSISVTTNIAKRCLKLADTLSKETQTKINACGSDDQDKMNENGKEYTKEHTACITRILNTYIEDCKKIKKKQVEVTINMAGLKGEIITGLLLELDCTMGVLYNSRACGGPLKLYVYHNKKNDQLKRLKKLLDNQLQKDNLKLDTLKQKWIIQSGPVTLLEKAKLIANDVMEQVTFISFTTYDSVYNDGTPDSVDAQLVNIINSLNQIKETRSKKNGNTPKTPEEIAEVKALEEAELKKMKESMINSVNQSDDELNKKKETSNEQIESLNEEVIVLNNEKNKLDMVKDELAKELLSTESVPSSGPPRIEQPAANTLTVQGTEQPIPSMAKTAVGMASQYSPSLASMASQYGPSMAKTAVGMASQYGPSLASMAAQYAPSLAQPTASTASTSASSAQGGRSRKKRTYYKKTRKRNCESNIVRF